MSLRICFNNSEDKFPLPSSIKERYGQFGFPENANTGRPYITSNLVMSIDGKASFQESEGTRRRECSFTKRGRSLADGFLSCASRSAVDWREHAARRIERGWKKFRYGIDEEELRAYRRDILKLGLQKVIVLTGSGNLDLARQFLVRSGWRRGYLRRRKVKKIFGDG